MNLQATNMPSVENHLFRSIVLFLGHFLFYILSSENFTYILAISAISHTHITYMLYIFIYKYIHMCVYKHTLT